MAFQTIYRLTWKDKHDPVYGGGQDFIIHISDTDSGVGTPTYHDLKIASCVLEVANGGDDPFTIVRPSTLSFSFIPTQTYGLNTFKSGIDRRFLVEAFAANTTIPIFKGYLLTDETRQSLLPVSVDGSWATHTVDMTAIDNLATLKEFPLTDDADANPRGWFKTIQYIAWVLKKTGHDLPINIVDSIVYAVTPSTQGNWYNTTYLWSKSFEADVNVSVDCYEALELLLKGRFITQYLGEWWIIRVDEMIGGEWNIFKYDSDGNYLVLDSNTYEKTLGKTQAIKFLNKDAFVFPVRPNKYDLLEYRYELPKELIDNYNFERGAQTFAGSYVDPDDGITKEEKRYTLEDWTIGRYAINSEVAVSSASISPFIRRIFHPVDYEIQRYLVIPVTNQANPNVYLRSNAVPVSKRDRLIFSVDFKFTSTGISDFQNIWYALLKGEDGNYYWYNPAGGGVWQNTNIYGSPSVGTFSYQYHYTDNPSKVRWASLGYDMKEVPISGEVYFFLGTRFDSALIGEIHYQNISIDYLPYINGSFSKYSGQYCKVSQTGDYKANLEEEVNISDSPKRMFKGALHYLTDTPGVYALTGSLFWDYRLSPTGGLLLEKFGKYQAFDFFNQNYGFVNKVQSSFVGLNSLTNPSNMPGMIHQYEIDFSSNDDHTADRIFQLISFKQDLISCRWEGVLVPTNNTTEGHVYTWDHEFKYRPQ